MVEYRSFNFLDLETKFHHFMGLSELCFGMVKVQLMQKGVIMSASSLWGNLAVSICIGNAEKSTLAHALHF